MPRLVHKTALILVLGLILLAAIIVPAVAAPTSAENTAVLASPPLTAEAIDWIGYNHGMDDTAIISPEAAPAFITQLVELYTAARGQRPLSAAEMDWLPYVPPHDYSPRLLILTAARQLIYLRARPPGTDQVDIQWEVAGGRGEHTVTAPALHAFIGTARDLAIRPQPLALVPRDGLRIGMAQRIRGDYFEPADALHVFLMPASNWRQELGPLPYPGPNAALLATYHDWLGGSLDLPVHWADIIGSLPDDQPLHAVPGPYTVAVISEGLVLASGETWGGFRVTADFDLLPAKPPPRVAAVKCDRVAVWTPGADIYSATLTSEDRPRRDSYQNTWVSSALADSLGMNITRQQPGIEIWSAAAGTPTITLTAGSPVAAVGYGSIDLQFPAEMIDGSGNLMVNFSPLRSLLEYEVQWAGPEEVYFRRGVSADPPELSKALGYDSPPAHPPAFTIVVNGQTLIGANPVLIGGTTYIPLRAVGAALRSEVRWDAETGTAYLRLADWQVVADSRQIHVVKGGESQLLSQGPINVEGHLFLPLRGLIQAMGGQVTWDFEHWTIWIII